VAWVHTSHSCSWALLVPCLPIFVSWRCLQFFLFPQGNACWLWGPGLVAIL
jgi:hypothetical protein